ncbi:2-oxo-tetronate isomerase [Ideonella sp. A 288]|uniref:2-oxo-tetronate isomerase n=1 Tax=Ideonella sp. A 288 TaxID=1962181 RepID=UPI000B4A82B6|nr:2-oxo-tetronate isomerase [Ideonella sp. A 288]
MPRFAANLSMLYTELPFLDRFEAASRDGFRAVEYLFPYAFDAAALRTRLQDHGLQQVLFNAPPGGRDGASAVAAFDAGQRGTACLPGREDDFRTGVAMALEYAAALSCPRIHVMAGLAPAGADRAALRATYVANLAWAAQQAAGAGLDVLIEPINTRDIPGFFLNRQAEAHAIVAEVGAPNLKVQMDLYHCQIVEGDVAMKLRQYLPTGRVGHLQVAGVPERHEPDIGELNHDYLFKVIDELGFDGWIGCEYRPSRGAQPGGTSAGLGWMNRLATASSPGR